MKRFTIAACIGTIGLTFVAADAGITGVTQYRYEAEGLDANGTVVSASVADLYLLSDDVSDVALNVYNANITNSVGANEYFQAPVDGYTWKPINYSAGTTFAWRHLDSFVSIGGMDTTTGNPYQASTTSHDIDPNFGGITTLLPGANAGWYTTNPVANSGAASDTTMGLGIFIGRFSIEGASNFMLEGSLEVTWNQGIGTAWQQGSFNIQEGHYSAIPGAGGSLALLAAAGLRRRRRS